MEIDQRVSRRNENRAMAMMVVGGSGRGVGKTALICGLIAGLPEFRWTAVKISRHAHQSARVWEETEAGHETDTARYLSAGAKRALLVSAPGDELQANEIDSALASEANVIFESNWIVELLQPDISLAIFGRQDEVKSSFQSFVRRADAIVMRLEMEREPADVPGVPLFRLDDFGEIPPEMLAWLRGRLGARASVDAD